MLFVAVSPNGLGHARRVLGVLSRVRELAPGVRIDLAIEAWQAERLADWPAGREVLAAATLHHGVMAPGPTWSTDPAAYDDGRLETWERRLAEVPALGSAHVVVSDNLAGVLAHRPDAVLMGSFLASDVLAAAHPGSAPVEAFVARERALLAAHRPPMLCVGPMAMPGVLERTAAVPLPWMCEQVVDPDLAPEVLVAVVGGRTGAAEEVLKGVTQGLSGAGITVAAAFDHRPASYARCHAVVARPGLGTVHDCIAAGVPMVAAYESNNVELAHNARRIAEVGLGVDAGPDPDPSTVVEAVRQVLEPATRAEISSRMAGLPKDGLAQAATWLTARLNPPNSGSISGL